MALRIVTDSVSDLPHEVAEELGITVIPLLIRLEIGSIGTVLT